MSLRSAKLINLSFGLRPKLGWVELRRRRYRHFADATQLNSTSSWVELCRYKQSFRPKLGIQIELYSQSWSRWKTAPEKWTGPSTSSIVYKHCLCSPAWKENYIRIISKLYHFRSPVLFIYFLAKLQENGCTRCHETFGIETLGSCRYICRSPTCPEIHEIFISSWNETVCHEILSKLSVVHSPVIIIIIITDLYIHAS